MQEREYLTETISFRITRSLKDKLETLTKKLGFRSVSSLINALLEKATKRIK